MHALIVDDDQEIVQLIPLLLPEYTFTRVTSGKQALQSMRENPPGLVLLDLMMPEMDGLEVLQEMRAQKVTRDIPVIILSAKYQEAEIRTALQAGADGYLVKPFDTEDLRHSIEDLLAKKSS